MKRTSTKLPNNLNAISGDNGDYWRKIGLEKFVWGTRVVLLSMWLLLRVKYQISDRRRTHSGLSWLDHSGNTTIFAANHFSSPGDRMVDVICNIACSVYSGGGDGDVLRRMIRPAEGGNKPFVVLHPPMLVLSIIRAWPTPLTRRAGIGHAPLHWDWDMGYPEPGTLNPLTAAKAC